MIGPVKREYKASAPKATRFMNVKHRLILRTARGKYIVRTESGVKYNPKAKYYKNPAGSTVATKYVKNLAKIPSPIRPKFERLVRKNAGVARGKYAEREVGVRVHHVKRRAYISELHEGHAPKRPVGRPRKSPVWNLPNPHIRKERSNKGKKRGPRAKK